MFPFHTWLPLAHVEAPDGRLDPAGGRPPEGRRLRPAAIQHGDDPARGEVSSFPLLAIAGGHRHHLRRPGRRWRRRTSSGWSRIARSATWDSSSSGFSRSMPTGMEGAVIQMVNHGVTTGRCSPASASSTSIPHPRDGRNQRPLEPAPAAGLLPDPHGARLGGRAGAQRVRRRVPDPDWDVRREPKAASSAAPA